MTCRVTDMRSKEVINVCDGHRFGFVGDVELDVVTGQVLALIIPGPYRFFGLFGREDDYIVPWSGIVRISEDIVLVEVKGEIRRGRREKKGFFTWSPQPEE